MVLPKILDTSIVISLSRYLCRWYGKLEQRIVYIYRDSQTYSLTSAIRKKTNICFSNSFLGKIAKAKQAASGVLDNSRVVKYLISLYREYSDKVINYLSDSWTIIFAKDIKEELYFFPVRIISIVVITAITVNIGLFAVLQKQIGLWGWLMRGAFLVIAVSGLFCKVDWANFKRNSVLLRRTGID